MSAGLRISSDVVLPLDLVTEPIGVLANRGRGKSYTTHVLVEEIHAAGVPVVILDVKGDWWGLRSAATGTGDGLPFYILGGDRPDVPLEPTAGQLMADLVVDQRVSVVLDLSLMSKTKQRSFTVAFAEQLYHRNRDNVFLVVDEADVLIPQRATAETARLIGAMEDIAKRGRGRGIGMAVVTQRPQEVAKSVLDLMDTLILLGMTGPRSMKSVREWIGVHVDEHDEPVDLMATLPKLPVGTAWVWSPLHDLLQRTKVRRINTFDSHVTPKPGQKRKTPKARATLDLEQLGQQIADTVEKAKADDPKVLRTRIRDLEQHVADLQLQLLEAEPERIEIPVPNTEALAELGRQLAERMADARASLEENLLPTVQAVAQLKRLLDVAPTPPAHEPRPSAPRAGADALDGAARRRLPLAPPTANHDVDVKIGKTERALLSVLVVHGPRTHSQLALQAGYSAKASTIGVALGKLRKAGLVEPGQPITATAAGVDHLGDNIEQLPTGDALIDYWRDRFGLTERRVLDALIKIYPSDGSTQWVADETGYSPTASTIGVALGKLRKVQVVKGWRLSDEFAQAAGLA